MKDKLGCKNISVNRLIELLSLIPSNYRIYTYTLANTGNLPVVNSDNIQIGYIDIWNEIFVDFCEVEE